MKTIEGQLNVSLIHPGTGIGHHEHTVIRFGAHAHVNMVAGSAISGGVCQQIGQDLTHPIRVSPNGHFLNAIA